MDAPNGTLHSQPTVFNPAQLFLLDIFAGIQSDEELNDIKKLVDDINATLHKTVSAK